MHEALLAVSLLLSGSPVFADCNGAPPSWGTDWSAYQSWCTSCCGTFHANGTQSSCDPGSNWGCGGGAGAAAPGISAPAPAVGGIQGAVLQGISNGIQQGLRNAAEQRRQADAAAAAAAAERQRQQQAENDRAAQTMMQSNAVNEQEALNNAKRLEDADKSAAEKAKKAEADRVRCLASKMHGLGDEKPSGPDYAAERRVALAKMQGKPDETWCKLNLIHTRRPTRPISDIGDTYADKVKLYREWTHKWDARCGGPSAQPGYVEEDLTAEDPCAGSEGPTKTGLALKDLSAPTNPPAKPSASGDLKDVSIRRSKTLDCAMAEVYLQAESMGKKGQELALDMKRDVRKILADLRKEAPTGEPDAVTVLSGGQDYAIKDANGEQQFISKLSVQRNEKTGEVHIDVMSSATGADGQEQETQNLIVLDRTGHVKAKEVSANAEKCLNKVAG